jgi:hypothetical protein
MSTGDNLSPQQFSQLGSIWGMKDGDRHQITNPKTGKSALVSHYEEVPDGDNGAPARGYKRSTWVVSGDHGSATFASSPYRKHEQFIRDYAHDQTLAHLRKTLM